MVVGREKRDATPAEIAKMEAIVDQAMREGALGVSSSLQYIPNIYSSTEELIALAKVAAKYGENAPTTAVCCNACRTCVTTNLVGVGMAAVAAAGLGLRRAARRLAVRS